MGESHPTQSHSDQNRILVVGATGDLGGTITRMLLKQGKSVRILARANSRYQPSADAGAHVVFGDLKNPTSLDPACKDIETVITTANSGRRGGDDNTATVDLQGNRSLIDAARTAGVKQFIYISAQNADPSSPVPLLQAKGKTEEYLQASGVPYTIIAPDVFMDIWVAMLVMTPASAGKPVTLVGDGRRTHSFVFSPDVAQLAVACVGHPKAINQRLVIGGPEVLSLLDTVKILEHVQGRSIPVNFVQLGQPVPNILDSMQDIVAALELYDSAADMSGISRDFGLKPTSVESFFRGAQPISAA